MHASISGFCSFASYEIFSKQLSKSGLMFWGFVSVLCFGALSKGLCQCAELHFWVKRYCSFPQIYNFECLIYPLHTIQIPTSTIQDKDNWTSKCLFPDKNILEELTAQCFCTNCKGMYVLQAYLLLVICGECVKYMVVLNHAVLSRSFLKVEWVC